MYPTMDLAGLTIAEPMTTVTDYLITVAGVAFAIRVLDASRPPRWLWSLAFLFIAIAAFLGGTSHGFVGYLADDTLRLIWKGTVYCVGLSMVAAVAGAIEGTAPGPPQRRLLHALNGTAFIAYAAWMSVNSAFLYVVAYYVPAMIAVALMELWHYHRARHPAAPWFVAGVAVTLLGAVIQQSGLSLHRHFNNNDIYHVVQIAGLWLLYRGVRLSGK